MPVLENNITALKMRIESACNNAKRSADEVTLLAVSKTRAAETIKLAYDAGLRQFGENYVTEAAEKIPQLPDDICWHFIGPIQSNKSRIIAELFDWVQSIDREKIIRRLSEQRPDHQPPLQCLIQVNIDEEPQKAGISPYDVRSLAKLLADTPRLELRGLMAIPKAQQNAQDLRQNFAKMAALLTQIQDLAPRVDTLSMGMSQDMEYAIAEGATMVRIGTDLFGPRQ